MSNTDSICVHAEIAVDPAVAFTLFTDDISIWWTGVKDMDNGNIPRTGSLKFEGQLGGSLVETYPDRPPYTVGAVLAWQPGARLSFEWRPGSFAPQQTTYVDVTFEAVPAGTRVVIVHRGLDTLPLDHPVRHGFGRSLKFRTLMETHWLDLLDVFRQHASSG